MNIPPSQYVSNLFRIACEQIGCDYTKILPEKLQKWSIEGNHKTFIALLGVDQSITTNNSQANTVDMTLTLVACVETTKLYPEDDYSNEQLEYWQNECDSLIFRFSEFVRKNDFINDLNFDIEEVFKDPDYMGIGKGLTMSFTLNDTYDYCQDFNNNQTKSIWSKIKDSILSIFEP